MLIKEHFYMKMLYIVEPRSKEVKKAFALCMSTSSFYTWCCFLLNVFGNEFIAVP